MRNLTTIQPQSKCGELTPGELAEIDQFQDRNRGFSDDGEEFLENYFDLSYED